MVFYSEKFVKLIESRNIKLKRLAAELNVSRNSLYNWIQAKKNPTPKNIMLISDFFNINPTEISIYTREELKLKNKNIFIAEEYNHRYEQEILNLKNIMNSIQIFLDYSNKFFFTINRNYQVIYCNSLCYRLFNKSNDDIIGMSIASFPHLNFLINFLRKVFLEKRIVSECDINLALNRKADILLIPLTELEIVSKIYCLINFKNNIDLNPREYDIFQILEKSSIGTLLVNHNNGKYYIYNDTIKNIQGYSKEDFERDPLLWYKMIHEPDRARIKFLCDNFKLNQLYIEKYKIINKNGELVEINQKLEWIKINGDIYCFSQVEQCKST